MISDVILLLNNHNLQLPINFFAHSLTFIGAFYVAMHARHLPHWHVTPLWYVGLASLLNAFAILFQYIIGPQFHLSYWNISLFSETLSNLMVSLIAVAMLAHTVYKDLAGRRKRLSEQSRD